MKSTLNRAKRAMSQEKIDAPVQVFPTSPRGNSIFSTPIEIPKENLRVPSPPANSPASDDIDYHSMVRLG